MLKFNFNLIVSLPFTTAKEQRSVRVQSEIQDSESARVIENLSSGCRRSASIGMSAGEENSPPGFVGRCRLGLAECIRKLRSNVLITGAALLLVGLSARSSKAQFYAGVLGGVSTLSGDTSAVINSNSTNFSTYNPQNGLALNGLLGRQLSDIFTIQADYVWNRNPLNLTGSTSSSGSVADYEETRRSSQQSLFASVMVYFRNRRSRIRPYLSVGTGWVHLSSTETAITVMQGSPVLAPREFSANMIGLRVPVGIDVTLHEGWAFRYTFSETLSRNPISDELSPPGPHSLKNFQNLIGIVYRF